MSFLFFIMKLSHIKEKIRFFFGKAIGASQSYDYYYYYNYKLHCMCFNPHFRSVTLCRTHIPFS